MKDKVKFWNGNKLSIKGKVRIANSFILSKLFYRLECTDILIETVKEIETLLLNFIWNNRTAGRVNRNVLLMGYESGGLQLYDIIERMKIMRVRWLRFLLSLDVEDDRRQIVDKLIGTYRNIEGLKILHHDIEKVKLSTKSFFYERSIDIWKSMKIDIEVTNTNQIKKLNNL